MATPKRTIKVRKRIKRIVKKKPEDGAADGAPVPVAEPPADVAIEVLPVDEPVAVAEPTDPPELPESVSVDESDALDVVEDEVPVAPAAPVVPVASPEPVMDALMPPTDGDWQVDIAVPEPQQVYPEGGDEDKLRITQQIVDHPVELQQRASEPLQSKYHHLLDSIYDAVFITDQEGTILQTNARAEQKFKMSQQVLREVNIIDLIAGADTKLMDVLRDNSDHRKFTLLEAVCVTEEEGRFDAEIVVNRMFGEDEKQFCFFVRDISRRKKTEQKVQEMTSKLEDVEKDSKVFETVSSLLHQFNDPVQVLICLAELEGKEDYRKPLGKIESVLQKLIEFASQDAPAKQDAVEGGDATAPPEPCDAGRVLVVDDDPMVAKMFQKTLLSGIPDLVVDVATDEAGTLDLFGKHHHALLVVDAQMPQISAVVASNVLGEMCAGRTWQAPKLVFCAGSAIDDALSGLLAKHPEYVCLRKPFKPADLIESVRQNLGAAD